MSIYKVKETPVSHKGTRFDPGSEVELTDEEAQNIGLEYLEKTEAGAEPTPPEATPPAGDEGGSQSETGAEPPAGGDAGGEAGQ